LEAKGMIAQRRMVDVTEPRIVLDFGEEYSLFKGHRVEIIIISESSEMPVNEGIKNTVFNRLSGAMRGSVKYISSDFDESDDGDDWEAVK
jgi:hypothetical protein